MRPHRQAIADASPDLTDLEWSAIEPLLPKVRGIGRADDRRVLSGILWRLRTGEPWAKIPRRYGPSTTCHARFRRWRDRGVWAGILAAIGNAYRGEIEYIEASATAVPPCSGQPSVSVGDLVAWFTPNMRVPSFLVAQHDAVVEPGLSAMSKAPEFVMSSTA